MRIKFWTSFFFFFFPPLPLVAVQSALLDGSPEVTPSSLTFRRAKSFSPSSNVFLASAPETPTQRGTEALKKKPCWGFLFVFCCLSLREWIPTVTLMFLSAVSLIEFKSVVTCSEIPTVFFFFFFFCYETIVKEFVLVNHPGLLC